MAIAVLAFLLSIASAFLAYSAQRPITASLAFVFGVTVVGATAGVRGGLAAGLVGSLIYNLFLSDPYLRFTFDSLDDIVPILAFNISAVGSGLIAGRLRDRAQAAERATSRMHALFEMSQSLQRAFDQCDVVATASRFLCGGPISTIEIYLDDGQRLVSQSPTSDYQPVADDLWKSAEPHGDRNGALAFLLGNSAEPLGVLVAGPVRTAVNRDDVRAFATILSFALERCRLAARLGQADVLRRSEEFKTALLSSVSHDLRTPLSAIAASATSLSRYKDSLDDQTKQDLLDTIQEQCDRLDRLTTNLLSLGRIQGGLDISHMAPVDAIEVLGSVLARVRGGAKAHNFEKRLEVAAAPVRSEAVMLEQMFYNILENAVVHTEPGTTILTTAKADRERVSITIEDNGHGIPEPDLGRVFDRFFQGAPRPSGGSGLGLSIAKGFAESIGGHVQAARARKLGGACIEIVLPSAAGEPR